MKKNILPFLMLFSVLLYAEGPVVNPDGMILYGGKYLRLTDRNQIILTVDNAVDFNLLLIFGLPSGDVNSVSGLRNHNFSLQGNRIKVVSDLIPPKAKEAVGKVTSSLELMNDQTIKLRIEARLNQGEFKQVYGLFSGKKTLSGHLLLDSKTVPIGAQDMRYGVVPKLSADFFSENPAETFGVTPLIYSGFSVINRTKSFSFSFKDGVLEILFNLK